MKSSGNPAARIVWLLLPALIAGCGSTSEAPLPAHLEVVNSPRPLGVPGYPLLDTVVVRLADSSGLPRARVPLTWAVQQGGSIEVLNPTTDADGQSRAVWTLGPSAGTNRLTIRSSEDSVSLEVVGTAFRVDQLDSDAQMACGLRGGDLWCWPWNQGSAPYSRGPDSPIGTTFNGPTLVSQGRGYIDLAAAGDWGCGLTAGGVVECFRNLATTQAYLPDTPKLRSLASSGTYTFCGLADADSTAWCWSEPNVHTALQVPGSPKFTTISVEGGQDGQVVTGCGLLVDSTAACWGLGPVGDGTTSNRASPVPVAGGRKFAEITAGYTFACGRQADNQVWCWGNNGTRQLNVDGPNALSPVLSATAVTRISAGDWTVGVVQGSQAGHWGQTGHGPTPLAPLAQFTSTAVAEFSKSGVSCLRLLDGEVYCYHEIWVNSSTLDIDLYLGVQPSPSQLNE